MKYTVSIFATLMALSTPAFAQDAASGWSGEGSASASSTTGNTETTDFGLGLNLAKEVGLWKYKTEALADFGKTAGIETRNTFFLAGQADRQINDRLFGFGRVSYENNQFSGYDSRSFFGGGLGYEIYNTDTLNWSVNGGPGFKIDEVKRIITTAPGGGALIIPATTQESFSAIGASDFSYDINDNVVFSNNTRLVYAEDSSQLGNVIALTAGLTDSLSARFSFDVQHDTNPPLGFEDTDTITRFSVVYGFGK